MRNVVRSVALTDSESETIESAVRLACHKSRDQVPDGFNPTGGQRGRWLRAAILSVARAQIRQNLRR